MLCIVGNVNKSRPGPGASEVRVRPQIGNHSGTSWAIKAAAGVPDVVRGPPIGNRWCWVLCINYHGTNCTKKNKTQLMLEGCGVETWHCGLRK